MDHGGKPSFVELPAQLTHVNVDDIGTLVIAVGPDLLEQHGARNHLSGVVHQIFEQPVFAREQLDDATAALDLPLEQIDVEVSDPKHRLAIRNGAATQQNLDARRQLEGLERLRKVIVATGA